MLMQFKRRRRHRRLWLGVLVVVTVAIFGLVGPGALKDRCATITASATQGSDSLFKSISATVAPPPPSPGSGLVGTIPPPGKTALMVLSADFTPEALVGALADASCSAQTIGLLQGGGWSIYVPGAPAAVNAGFPTSLPDGTPFFVRCQ